MSLSAMSENYAYHVKRKTPESHKTNSFAYNEHNHITSTALESNSTSPSAISDNQSCAC
jgi:hypothetical protein